VDRNAFADGGLDDWVRACKRKAHLAMVRRSGGRVDDLTVDDWAELVDEPPVFALVHGVWRAV